MHQPRTLLGALVALSAASLAQQVPPVAPGRDLRPGTSEVVELNPFVITESADTGYAPSETLSGTRLRSLVKDVPSAITMLSEDMLRDLGARDFNDVLDFLPSTMSYQGNEADANNNGQRTGNPFLVRGFRSDSMTTNFFATMTPVDTYNTTRLSFTRGPNSIVFGVGNPGGALDIVTNRPQLRRNFHSISGRGDTFGGYRINTDTNLTLVPDKVGVRVDLLEEDRRRYVYPAFNRRSSIYGAVTYRPLTTTTITVEGEMSRIRRKVPRSVVTFEQVTPWLEAGKPMKPVYGNTTATPGLEFNNATSHALIIEGQPQIPPMNWARSAFSTRYKVNNVLVGLVSFAKPTLVPMNVNIDGDGDDARADTKNAAVYLQQAIGKRLFIELAGRYDYKLAYNFEGLGAIDNVVRIDANGQLPNGQLNPNAGLPYLETINAFWSKSWTETAQDRLTASYEVDLSRWKPFGRSLGKLAFAGLAHNDRSHQRLDYKKEVNQTPLVTTGTSARLDNGVNAIRRRYYLQPGRDSWLKTDWAPFSANGISSSWERAGATPRNNVTETTAYSGAVQADLLENLLVLTGGMRRERMVQTQGVYVRDERGVFPGVGGVGSTLSDRSTGTTYSAGFVLNLTRHVAVFGNKANNFLPSNQSVVDISGSPADPIQGDGYDAGIRWSVFGGKLQGSVEKFSTEQSNLTDGTLIGIKKTGIAAIWGAIDLNRVPNETWQDFRTLRTDGYEFQLVGNPTDNLRLMLTASRNTAVLKMRGRTLQRYIAEHRALWLANAGLASNSTLAPTVGGILTRIDAELANDLTEVGRPLTRTSRLQVSTVARYKFGADTRLRGFAVGTASYWRGAPIIGYHTLPGSVLYDITQPYYGAEKLNIDVFLDYSRTTPKRRVRWDSQLRVQNVLDDRTAKPWTALDDGTGGRFVQQRLFPEALGVSLSTTFAF